MQKYTYLLFDVDNTLLDFDRAEGTAIVETFAEAGLPTDAKTVELYSRINHAHWKMLERGEIERETLFWHRFWELGEQLGIALDAKSVAQLYFKNLSTKSFLCEDAEEVCAILAKTYTLCTVTNGQTGIQKARFNPSPLFPYFSKCFISEEIGHVKPSPAFFAAVREALPNLDPKKTLLIGDSLTSDIAGGHVLGCDTCWICSPHLRNKDEAFADIVPTYRIERLKELLTVLQVSSV